jgi:hypothetical protein
MLRMCRLHRSDEALRPSGASSAQIENFTPTTSNFTSIPAHLLAIRPRTGLRRPHSHEWRGGAAVPRAAALPRSSAWPTDRARSRLAAPSSRSSRRRRRARPAPPAAAAAAARGASRAAAGRTSSATETLLRTAASSPAPSAPSRPPGPRPRRRSTRRGTPGTRRPRFRPTCPPRSSRHSLFIVPAARGFLVILFAFVGCLRSPVGWLHACCSTSSSFGRRLSPS